MQESPAVRPLDDTDVLVERRLLVDEPLFRLDRARRNDEEKDEERSHGQVAHAEQEARRRGQQRRDHQECALRADRRDEHERGEEDPEQRPGRREGVEVAGHRSGGRDRGDGEPDGERRHHSEEDDRRRAQQEHGEKAPDHGARRRRVEPFDREVEERLRCEGDHRNAHRGGKHDEAQEPRLRAAVGELASEPVAGRECTEDDPDQVCPDDRRRAEVRGEKPRGGDLGRERADPGAEHERAEREAPRALAAHGIVGSHV